MKYPKYVQVSLDAPDSWWDPKAGMWFRKSDGIVELKDYIDGTNIVKYVRLNYLIDVTSLVNPPKAYVDVPTPMITKTPKQLLQEVEDESEEVEEEIVEEIKEENPTCPFCGKQFVPKGLPNHMRFCKERPDKK